MRNLIPYLYLPIETWAREYHAKVLLAVQAAAKDWTVVLGPKTTMDQRLQDLPQGTVFQFGLHENFSPAMRRLRACGHQVVTVDEEGLVTLSPERYLRYRVSKAAMESCDASFCWGKVQHEILKDVLPRKNCCLEITGNPRVDLLRPEFRDLIEDEAATLRKQHGRFVLINGNFGSYNHVMGANYLWQALKEKGWMRTPEDEEFHRKRIALQGRFFNAFMSALPELCRAGHKVIVRPHPSEDLRPWEQVAESFPGQVKVIREGNIVPWLQAAEVVVHNGCTTAVEAFVLGKPVIAYRPEKWYDLETELPNEISVQVCSVHELLEVLGDPAKCDKQTRNERMEYAKAYIAGLEGKMASALMVDALPRANLEHSQRVLKGVSSLMRILAIDVRFKAASLLRKGGASYAQLKCGPLSKTETQDVVSKYARRLGMSKEPTVRPLGNGLLLICGNGPNKKS